MKLTIVLEPQKGGGYTVYVPSLRGCISQGETLEGAIDLYMAEGTNSRFFKTD